MSSQSNVAKAHDYAEPGNAELQKIVHEYSEFAYVVSHDLQSPIRQLKGFTECLLNSLDSLTPQQQAYKEMIDHVAEQAEKTLDALLVFSRLNTDEKTFEKLNSNEIIEQSFKRLGIKPENFNGTIDVQENMPPIYGDQNLMIQVFYHILDNAIKFQQEEQKPIIKISCTQQDNLTTFCIEDNGIGIDPAKLHLAFVILRKLNADPKYEGRGAGLSFAKKIIEIHKGTITLDSAPDKGTKVTFSCGLGPNDQFEPFARPI